MGRVAREAGVGCLVLTHIVPPDANRSNLLAQAREEYAGPVIVGEDLMAIDVITGTVQWGDMSFCLPTR